MDYIYTADTYFVYLQLILQSYFKLFDIIANHTYSSGSRGTRADMAPPEFHGSPWEFS